MTSSPSHSTSHKDFKPIFSALAIPPVAGLLFMFTIFVTTLRDEWSLIWPANDFSWRAFLPDGLILIYLAVLSCLVILYLARLGQNFRQLLLKASILAVLMVAVALCAYWEALARNDDFSLNTLRYYTSFYAVLFVNAFFIIPRDSSQKQIDVFHNQDGKVFFASTITICAIIFLFSPAALYSSSPDFFSGSSYELIKEVLPWAIGFAFASLFLWFLTPKKMGSLLALGACVVATWSILNSFVFTRDFGPMNGFTFVNPDISGSKWVNWTMDISIAVLIAEMLVVQFLFNWAKHLRLFFYLTCLASLFFCLFVVATDKKRENKYERNDALSSSEKIADSHLFEFSARQPNVLIIMLDSFDSEHLNAIFDKEPSLAAKFEGFTVYPDTVANASCTLLSLPSIYGGPAYIPEASNKRPELSILDKEAEALSTLPQAFADSGFQTALIGNAQASLKLERVKSRLKNPASMDYVDMLPDYYLKAWKEKIGLSDEKVLGKSRATPSIIFSLFRAAPNVIKGGLYKRWENLNVSAQLTSVMQDKVLRDSALLGLLPEMASVKADKPTMKFIVSELTHALWFLPPNSPVPSPINEIKPDPSDNIPTFYSPDEPLQYYSERHALRFIADFLDWLKQSGIYDNTKIILVSDHNHINWGFYNKELNAALKSRDASLNLSTSIHGDPLYIIRPASILVVKDLNASGEIKWSDSLMQTSDVAAIACEVIKGCPGIKAVDSGPERIRTHVSGPWVQDKHPSNTYIYKEFTIKGNMRDIDNWSW